MNTDTTTTSNGSRNEFEERARFNKANKVATFLAEHFGNDVAPTNEACRIAARILIENGELADREFSDRSCEMVRCILTVRGELTHTLIAMATAEAEATAAVKGEC